jgi:hypothetical protein
MMEARMNVFTGVLTALFKPAKGVDALQGALKYLWIPLVIILAASVVGKAVIAAPMQSKVQQEAADTALKAQTEQMSAEERASFEKDMEQIGGVETINTVANTAAIVFGIVGAAFALLYIGTFFFVAARTWGNGVNFSVMLSVAGLSLLPHALRNIVQMIYMGVTGVLLQYPGLGALVAPKDAMTAPSTAYAVLSQIDLWVIWGVIVLFGALMSKTVGLEKKRAVAGITAFVVITGLFQAVPTIVSGVFMRASGM